MGIENCCYPSNVTNCIGKVNKCMLNCIAYIHVAMKSAIKVILTTITTLKMQNIPVSFQVKYSV